MKKAGLVIVGLVLVLASLAQSVLVVRHSVSNYEVARHSVSNYTYIG